ncbi:MAG: restriction endonuclease subunit S [Ruminococcus sp.]
MAKLSSSNGIEKFPKLRFPEFKEPWKQVKLSDFTERIVRKNKNNETDLPLTISSKNGLVDQISFFNKTVASKDISNYYLLRNGEFAYNKSYSVGYDFGSIKRLERYPMGALSTLYICFTLTKHNGDYIKTYFDSLKWYKEIYIISAEGARNHGLLNVPTDEFFDTYHYITDNPDEQQKIAAFMNLIDKRIQKQQQLLENIKKYKRGLSNKLFEDYSNNWIAANFADVFKFLQNNTFSRAELTCEETEILNIHYGDVLIKYGDILDLSKVCDIPFIKNNIDLKRYSGTSYLKNGDVVIADTAEDNTVGKTIEIFSASGKRILSGLHTIPCRSLISFEAKYLGYYLNSYSFRKQILPLIQGTKVSSISKSELQKVKVKYPEPKEQKRIVSILSLIDEKIYIAEHQLTFLKICKDGLLQQMFI